MLPGGWKDKQTLITIDRCGVAEIKICCSGEI